MTASDARPGRFSQGQQTRAEILRLAVRIAAAEGLESLTIGRLAKERGMSKSGLFAHFGSKEDLQLATIGAAKDIFIGRVIQPALETDRGLPRLRALLDRWLDYLEASNFRGGCFFCHAAAEFDGRPGLVRDEIARLLQSWMEALRRELGEAQSRGQLDPGADPEQIVFEFHAFVQEANWAYQLFQDQRGIARARAAVGQRLASLATEPRAGRRAPAPAAIARKEGHRS